MRPHVKRSTRVRMLAVGLLTPLLACGSDDPAGPAGAGAADLPPAVLAMLEESVQDLAERVLPSLEEADGSVGVLAASVRDLRAAIAAGADIEGHVAAVRSALERAASEASEQTAADLAAIRLVVETIEEVTRGSIDLVPYMPAGASPDVQVQPLP